MSYKQNPTIGVFLDDMGPYGISVWGGIADRAKQQNINLIGFVGELFLSMWTGDSQGKIIYKLPTAQTLDGLIMLSALISSPLSAKKFKNFYQYYHPLPIASIGKALPNIPSALIDNTKGLQDLLIHLIEDHGYKKIAFIKGPENNIEANERFTVYTDILTQYNLPFNPKLVAPGNFFPMSGANAVKQFFETQNTPIEAIVATNDGMALGALESLQQQGIQVPYHIAVTGFDNSKDSQQINPPLTTVKQPLYQLGQWALKTVLAQLEGKSTPLLTTFPTQLVIRQSCGCLSQSIQYASKIPNIKVVPSNNIFSNQALKLQLLQALKQNLTKNLPPHKKSPLDSTWAEQLLNAFWDTLQAENKNSFLAILNALAHQTIKEGIKITLWYNIISMLRYYLLPHLNNPQQLAKCENLWHQSQAMLGEMAQAIQTDELIQTKQKLLILRTISQRLISTFNVNKLMDVLAEELPRLGINYGYLAMYEHTANNKKTKSYKQPPKWARLLLAYNHNNKLLLKKQEARFQSSHLIPPKLRPSHQPYNLLIQPLYFKKEQLGFILLEIKIELEDIYATLRQDISSALKGALLVEEIQNHATTLEEVVALRTNALKQQTTQLIKAKEAAETINKAMERELTLANDIQQSLLLPPNPLFPTIEVACYCQPARKIGGDFYSYHYFNDNYFIAAIGDVSGKGVSAALLMAASLSLLNNMLTQNLQPKEILLNLDKAIEPYTKPHKQNCALCYLKINNGILSVANAGGIPPYILHQANKKVIQPRVGGLALGQGLEIPFEYQQAELSLSAGDLIVLVSDGLVEAKNNNGQMFGFEALEQSIAKGPQNSAIALLNHLQNSIKNFIGKSEPHDDITIMVLKI